MNTQFASRLLVMLGAVWVALAFATAAAAQTSHASLHKKPPIHHGRVVHHHVIVRHPVHTSLVRRRASLHHPHHVLPAHSHHAVIVHGRSAPHRPVVRHATVVRRHAALCQQVMVHQHWVQHCR